MRETMATFAPYGSTPVYKVTSISVYGWNR
jgi:hypothetical protein